MIPVQGREKIVLTTLFAFSVIAGSIISPFIGSGLESPQNESADNESGVVSLESRNPLNSREVSSGFESDPPENVVMIDIDTLRADHLGAYGYEKNTSPNLDRFAERNVMFENAVTPAAWTLPAQVSVFTSTYPRTHRVRGQRQKIPGRYVMLAELLKSNGFETAAFTGGASMAEKIGHDQGFDRYEVAEESDGQRRHFRENFRKTGDWLENNTGEKSFVFVHGYDAHAPYGVKEEYIQQFEDENYSGPIEQHQPVRPPELDYSSGNLSLQTEEGSVALDEEDVEQIRAGYDSDVRSIDAEFGDFIERLKDEGMYNDTAIIVYSSHGENLGDRVFEYRGDQYMFGHWYFWDHNINVPVIAHIPGSEPRKIERPVSLIDLAPTVYDLTDSRMSKKAFNQLRGESMLGILTDRRTSSRNYVFAEGTEPDAVAVRGQDWKLIKREGAENRLYSLDPEVEQSKEENAVVYRRLLEEIDDWETQTPKSMEEEVESDRRKDKNILKHFREGLSSLFASDERYLSTTLEKHGITVQDRYQLEEAERGEIQGYRTIEIVSEKSNAELDGRIFLNASPDFASDYIREQKQEIEGIYTGTVPYTTKLGAAGCEKDYQPEIYDRNVSGYNLTFIDLYADEARSYGACEEEAYYRARIALGYCPSQNVLFRLNWYSSSEKASPVFPKCVDA